MERPSNDETDDVKQVVAPDRLVEGYVRKRCQLLGDIHNVPIALDIGNRTQILDIVDNARRQGILPWEPSSEHSVTMSLSAYNVKIMKDDSEVVVGRIAIHEIAAVSYLHDDDQHLVIIKAGDSRRQKCTCYVFHCSRGRDAEEICNLIGQVFQLSYTEATMEQLDTAIVGGNGAIYSLPHHPTPSLKSPPGMQPSQVSPISPNPMEHELFAVDRVALTAEGHVNAPTGLERQDEGDSESDYESDDELSNTSQQMVQDYMQRLGKTLQPNEMKRFAELLTTYRQGKDVMAFFSGLQNLYGEARKFLLPGMRSFIPAEHREAFEQFMEENGFPEEGRRVSDSGGNDSKLERRKSRRTDFQRVKSKRSGAGPPRLVDVISEPTVPEAPEIEAPEIEAIEIATEPPAPPPPPPPARPEPDPNDVDAMLQSIQNEMDDMTASFS